MVANELCEFVVNGFIDVTESTQFASLIKNQKTQLKESRRKDAKALIFFEAAMTEMIFPKIEATNYSKEA
jgi:hypothetical protein